jgi:hypothetical protein
MLSPKRLDIMNKRDMSDTLLLIVVHSSQHDAKNDLISFRLSLFNPVAQFSVKKWIGQEAEL